MPKTITTLVYQFSELKDSAKASATEQLMAYDWWQDALTEMKDVYLNDRGIFAKDLYFNPDSRTFSLHIAQLDLDKVADNLVMCNELDEPVIELLSLIWVRGERLCNFITVNSVNDKHIYWAVCPRETLLFELWLEDRFEAFLADAQRYFNALCEQCLNTLQVEWDYLCSDENMIAMCEANDYWFTEQGALI